MATGETIVPSASFAKSLRNLTPKFKGLYNPKNSRLFRPSFPVNLVARLMADLMILNPCP